MSTENQASRSRLTRMKIGECILHMLERLPLSEIRISSIAKAAGISRMTFYHYYDTKEKALVDYLSQLIEQYHREALKKGFGNAFHTREHLEFTLHFFARHERYFLQMEKIGGIGLVMEGVNQFLESHFREHFDAALYDLYFYAGALLNVFLKWLHNGKKESPREIAEIVLKNSAWVFD